MRNYVTHIIILIGACLILNNEISAQDHSTANLSEARSWMGTTTVGSKIIFAGGLDDSQEQSFDNVDIYDTETDEWTTASLSEAFWSEGNDWIVTAGNLAFFVLTAEGESETIYSAVDMYDAETDSWSSLELSENRGWPTVTSHNDKIVFAGGVTDDYAASSVVDIFDVTTESWSQANLSEARFGMGTTTVGTKIIFAGGEASLQRKNNVDIYDTETDEWTTANLSEAFWSEGDDWIVTAGNLAFFVLTAEGESETIYSAVDMYDAETDSWSSLELSENRGWPTVESHNDKIVFAGGVTDDYSASAVVDIFDVTTESWSQANLSEARFGMGTTTVGSKIIFAGGEASLQRKNNVDIYDTETDEWTTASLSKAFWSEGNDWIVTAGNLAFFVLTAEGESETIYSAVDMYDAETDSWSSLELSENRGWPTVASHNDKIVFAGGVTDDYSASAVVDIFTVELPTSAEPTAELPAKAALNQNYPNPFNPSTVISYQLPVNSDVQLEVFNMLGQRVATLVSERQNAGHHSATFDASSLSSGVYLYRIQAGEFVEVRQMVLVK